LFEKWCWCSKRNFFWNNGFACEEPWKRLKPKKKIVMVVAALAAYKHDTFGCYLSTVLHFRLQANPIPTGISGK
jgi:hypothetical protein